MQRASHPNCCGYIPITVGSYGGDDDKELQDLIAIVQGQTDKPEDRSNKIYEIILNEAQIEAKPRLLKVMAALGFVFVARQHNGNYPNSWINQFIRVQRPSKAYKKPGFAWDGLSVVDIVNSHKTEPLSFKKRAVPNPFSKMKDDFNLDALDKFDIKTSVAA